MKKSVSLLLTGFVLLAATRAQTSSQPARETVQSTIEDERGLVALDQALRELTNPFTVVCVGARPGDEDDGALGLLRKKLGARVVMLFATRGEGEDSSTLAELGQELGAVHTREAIEAARVIGADVFFLNLRDLVYTTSPDEALSVWGHDDALRRMVRAIRLLRPDVIITNHNAKSGDGAEQAVARLAREAFDAAADTKLVPEAGSEAWRARRLFERVRQADADVMLNLTEYDRIRGRSYAEIGLAAHRRFYSRGSNFDRLTPDRETSPYKLTASSSDERLNPGSGLLDGLALPEKVTRSIAPPRVGELGVVDAIAAGERLADALIERLIEKRTEGTIDEMRERYGADFVRIVRFTAALERALALSLGLRLEVKLSDSVVVPGQKLIARLVLRNGSARAFPVVFSTPERLPSPDKSPTNTDSDVMGIGTGGVVSKELEYEIAKDAAITLPQSARLYDEEYYPVGSALPGAQPVEAFGERVLVSAEVGLGEVNIRLAALARFNVAPAVEISTSRFALIDDWSKRRDIALPVRVRNRTPGALAGALWVVPLALTQDNYEPMHIAFTREDEETQINLKLTLPILKPPLAPDVLIEFRREKPAPPDPLGVAKISVNAIGFKVSDDLKVGYIRGLDDWLSFALSELGVEHTELKVDEISVTEHGNLVAADATRSGCADLARFDAFIVDSNAYFARPELILLHRCLLRYARQGGNLIVLGQRPDDWKLILSGVQFSPYPITLSRDRISLASPVKILDIEHPLTTAPNKITSNDFEAWVGERAANVPREWSKEYTPLIESGNEEVPNRGMLLTARYGEGTVVMTSLALRRQLLAGNAGAYRIFSNLLARKSQK
ncbi:MAG TPA: PIG-L family deacetylase [Blastocatellia bacterium]